MSYHLILQDQYDLTPLVETMTLKDSLDQIAYQASVRVAVNGNMPAIAPGMAIRISGVPFNKDSTIPLLHPAVVWEVESSNSGTKRLSLVINDRTIYLDKSEDEYLFPKDQTATQRLQKYAKDWGIPLLPLPDTRTKLGKAVYRAQTIFSMILADLKETAKNGGDMYHPRMTSGGLQLFKLGSNDSPYVLDGMIDLTQLRTLEGTVTKVKVMTANENVGSGQEVPSKVLAVAEGDTKSLGTLQKLVEDDQVKSAGGADKLAKSHLTGIQETFTITAMDINTIRAGDAVFLQKIKLIVTSVSRDLGNPGSMTLELASAESVRRRYYLE
ncbi:XkdQ/YqbQ family protein [Paenibacillus pini]